MTIWRSSRLFIIVALTYLYAPVAAAPPDIPERTWYRVPNSALTAVGYPWPTGSTWGSIKWGVMSESGGSYDQASDRLLVWGGGHADYAGNEFYSFSLDTMSWTRINDPTLRTDPAGTTAASGFYPDASGAPDLQQPRTGHSYQNFQYVPELGRVCFLGISVTYQHGTNNDRTLCFDPASKLWNELPADLTKKPSVLIGGATARHAGTGDIYTLGTISRPWMGKWHPSTNLWTKMTMLGSEQYAYYRTAAIDHVHNIMVVIAGCRGTGSSTCTTPKPSYTFDLALATPPLTTLSMLGAEPIRDGVRNPGVVYDAVAQKVVAWNGGATVYTLDVPTRTWTAVPPAPQNTVIPTDPAPTGTYGRFAYSPRWNLYVLVNGITQDVYLYRLASPPDTTPPVLSVRSPVADQILQGTVVLNAIATDTSNLPLTLTAAIDGAPLSGLSLDTTAYANGRHSIAITATDQAGNAQTETITVLILNCPVCPACPPPGGQQGSHMPSLEDERQTYLRWGWAVPATPVFPTAFAGLPQEGKPFIITDPDIHDTTEGDDLWTSLRQYQRTGQAGYLERAEAWARYFRDDYRQCVGNVRKTYCYDKGFGLDHVYGWGLVAWYEHTGDGSYLAAAEAILGDVETHRAPHVPGVYQMGAYGGRAGGRHLLLAVEVARVTQSPRWLALRDKLMALWDQSPDWDSTYGVYFPFAPAVDAVLGNGAYAAGKRTISSFQMGILGEAFGRAIEETGHAGLKAKLIRMARFVAQYGPSPASGYVGYIFGVDITTGQGFQSNTLPGAPTPPRWNPAYSTAVVGLLARGARYASDPLLYSQAKTLFACGTQSPYDTTAPCTPRSTAHHYLDSLFDSSNGNMYYSFNKGELFYTYPLLIQEP